MTPKNNYNNNPLTNPETGLSPAAIESLTSHITSSVAQQAIAALRKTGAITEEDETRHKERMAGGYNKLRIEFQQDIETTKDMLAITMPSLEFPTETEIMKLAQENNWDWDKLETAYEAYSKPMLVLYPIETTPETMQQWDEGLAKLRIWQQANDPDAKYPIKNNENYQDDNFRSIINSQPATNTLSTTSSTPNTTNTPNPTQSTQNTEQQWGICVIETDDSKIIPNITYNQAIEHIDQAKQAGRDPDYDLMPTNAYLTATYNTIYNKQEPMGNSSNPIWWSWLAEHSASRAADADWDSGAGQVDLGDSGRDRRYDHGGVRPSVVG